MSKFIKYRSIEKNGVQYDCYIAADMIKGVGPVFIKDEEGIRLKEKENACKILTRDDYTIETENTQEEIMAQLAPELVFNSSRLIIQDPPLSINTKAFLAVLADLYNVYNIARKEAHLSNKREEEHLNMGRISAVQAVVNMVRAWQDKPTEEE